MVKRPEQRIASVADMAAAIGPSLRHLPRPTHEDLASNDGFETEGFETEGFETDGFETDGFEAGFITEETPLVERLRWGAHGRIERLMTAAEARPAPLLGAAAAVVLFAIFAVLIARPTTSSSDRRVTANSGTNVPTTAPITTPQTIAADPSPATTAESTTPTTGRVSRTTAGVAPPAPSSSRSTPPPTTSNTTSQPTTTTTASPTPTITFPHP